MKALTIITAVTFGILAMLVVPEFIQFRPRNKAAEAKVYLKYACAAQREFFEQRGRYAESSEELGFTIEPGNRYRFIFGPSIQSTGVEASGYDGPLADVERFRSIDNASLLEGVPPEVLAEVGLHGCPESCSMTIVAAGNIDPDETVDVWSISTAPRVRGEFKPPACIPWRDVDDDDNSLVTKVTNWFRPSP